MASDNLLPGRQTVSRAWRETATTLRQMTASRRQLPQFLIIGAQKAGTTSLYEYLCEHPRISPSMTKEVHYFDLAYHRGSTWYRAHFRIPRQLDEIAGESSPYYLFHPLVPKRVAADLPNSRLIVILRNPIDRAYSHYNHERALGYEELRFEDAIECEEERLTGEEDRILSDPSYRSFSHQHHSYIARSRYAEQLERWFRYFDREHFCILSAEDLFEHPHETAATCQRFLGLEPAPPSDVTARNSRSYTSIADSVRRHLRKTFEPHNQRVYELVGRDFGWA
jgi:Sulfotransferase domain